MEIYEKYLIKESKGKLPSAGKVSKILNMIDRGWKRDGFVRDVGVQHLKFVSAQAEEFKNSESANVWIFVGYKNENDEIVDTEFEGKLDKKQFAEMKSILKSIDIKASRDDESKNKIFWSWNIKI